MGDAIASPRSGDDYPHSMMCMGCGSPTANLAPTSHVSPPMEKLLFLDRLADAAPLSARCRAELLPGLRVRHLAQGTLFSRRAASPAEIVLIVSGIARVSVVTTDGCDVTQHFARAEEFVMPRLDPARDHLYDAEAVTDVVAVALSLERFERAMTHYPELSAFYAALLRERSMWARERRSRGEDIESYEQFLSLYPGLETQVPTVHLASYLGLSPAEYMRVRQRYRDRAVM